MQDYDRIGRGYAKNRRPDPRLAQVIEAALAGADSLVNVGAGAGGYEPARRRVVAVDPALTMIRQRAAGAAPAVRGRAERLPFSDGAFDAAMAVLTIHHWSDWRSGLRELARVARTRVVLFTWDPDCAGFWLGQDYLPDLEASDRRRFPTLDELKTIMGEIQVSPVPIPHDCSDGFLGAYWRRPAAYLDPAVRRGISSLAREPPPAGLHRLAADLDSGAWERKHGHLLAAEELDLGYRLVVSGADARRVQVGPR
jgi:SAM-dependent methyltransferase